MASTKKRRKQALGKGLSALIPDIDTFDQESGGSDYVNCDIEAIAPNPYQPRITIVESDLAELADSIREQGIIQPLIVRRRNGHYELVAGERRLRAAKMAGLTRVPCVVKPLSDAQMLEVSIVENIQRENLNPVEEAEAYYRLMDEFDLTQDQAAARVGKSRSAVANFLRIRKLPDAIRSSLVDGTLKMGHARAVLGLENQAHQMRAWRAIVAKKLSVRETERLVKRLKAEKGTQKKKETAEAIYFGDVADNLARRFGTKVQIRRRGRKGRIEIEFYSDSDLDRLLQLLQRGRRI